MYRLSATFRIAIGMTLLSSSVLLVAQTLGMRSGEVLALLAGNRQSPRFVGVRCSFLLNRNELNPLQQSLRRLVDHHPEVRSIALRKPGGELVLSAESDRARSGAFVGAAGRLDGRLLAAAGRRTRMGECRCAVRATARRRTAGHGPAPVSATAGGHDAEQPALVPAVSETGRCSTWTRREWSRSVCVVRLTRLLKDWWFWTTTNGLSWPTRLLLPPCARASDSVGRSLARFRWQDETGTSLGNSGPWHATLQDGVVRSGITVRLAGEQENESRCYVVNASPIVAEDGSRRGMLATFEDVTELERRREELKTHDGRPAPRGTKSASKMTSCGYWPPVIR